jgi:hypothetical protein
MQIIRRNYIPKDIFSETKARGNNRFDAIAPRWMLEQLPELPDGLHYSDLQTGLLLKGKNIIPHRDDVDVAENEERVGAVFGLLHHGYTKKLDQSFYLQVGDEMEILRPGNWVFFDDAIMHSVFSEALWYGVTFLVARYRNADQT